MAKKKQPKKNKTEALQPIIYRVPGFSSQFKEDLGWWFKQDTKKRYDPQLAKQAKSLWDAGTKCRPTQRL